MNVFRKFSPKEIVGAIVLAALFLTASFGSEQIARIIESRIDEGGPLGMILYSATVTGIVLIPLVNSFPMIPVAVALWGNVVAALLTLLGWMGGAIIAFSVARKFGIIVLRKFKILSVISKFAHMMPKQNVWWGTLLLASIGMPIDAMSYTHGLFNTLRLPQFISSLALGLAPFAFFITFIATLSIVYQTYIIGSMLILWFFVYARLRGRNPTSSALVAESVETPLSHDDASGTEKEQRRSKIMDDMVR